MLLPESFQFKNVKHKLYQMTNTRTAAAHSKKALPKRLETPPVIKSMMSKEQVLVNPFPSTEFHAFASANSASLTPACFLAARATYFFAHFYSKFFSFFRV